MAGTDLAVDRLRDGDVDAALALSDRVGWDARRADWRRLVDLDPVDAFAGRVDGRLVATATLVRYGSRVGWIGMMIVRPDARRRGHGTRMLRACLDAAVAAGVDAVGLDANEHGRPLYDAHGFVEAAGVTRWRGSVAGGAGPDRVTAVDDPDPFAAFDRRAAGVDRRFLLSSLLAEDGATALLRRAPDGAVAGYALVRRRPPGVRIGPLVAERSADWEALVRAAADRADGAPITVDAAGRPGDDYRRFGLDRRRSLVRMTRRERAPPLVGDRIRAIAAFEYG